MENRKTSKKVFNVISLILVCSMASFLALYLLVIMALSTSFTVGEGFKSCIPLIIAITTINAVRFIIEGIKTFNKTDDFTSNNKELTGSKLQKTTFAIINALFILVMVLIVVRPAQLSNSTIYSNAINSAFVLVPFAIFNTIRFLICKDNGVFAQGYKKPFKIAFIAGNILLLSAMIIYLVIAKITNKTLRLSAFETSAFYAFLLSAFNGIKFVIDDIKSARNCERVTPLFWNSKPKKILSIISATLLSVATAFITVFWYTHPTHYSYNDIWIVGKTVDQIEQRYGEYDTEERGEFGYFSRGYLVKKSKYSWRKTYYMINFDDDGIAYDTEIVND